MSDRNPLNFSLPVPSSELNSEATIVLESSSLSGTQSPLNIDTSVESLSQAEDQECVLEPIISPQMPVPDNERSLGASGFYGDPETNIILASCTVSESLAVPCPQKGTDVTLEVLIPLDSSEDSETTSTSDSSSVTSSQWRLLMNSVLSESLPKLSCQRSLQTGSTSESKVLLDSSEDSEAETTTSTYSHPVSESVPVSSEQAVPTPSQLPKLDYQWSLRPEVTSKPISESSSVFGYQEDLQAALMQLRLDASDQGSSYGTGTISQFLSGSSRNSDTITTSVLSSALGDLQTAPIQPRFPVLDYQSSLGTAASTESRFQSNSSTYSEEITSNSSSESNYQSHLRMHPISDSLPVSMHQAGLQTTQPTIGLPVYSRVLGPEASLESLPLSFSYGSSSNSFPLSDYQSHLEMQATSSSSPISGYQRGFQATPTQSLFSIPDYSSSLGTIGTSQPSLQSASFGYSETITTLNSSTVSDGRSRLGIRAVSEALRIASIQRSIQLPSIPPLFSTSDYQEGIDTIAPSASPRLETPANPNLFDSPYFIYQYPLPPTATNSNLSYVSCFNYRNPFAPLVSNINLPYVPVFNYQYPVTPYLFYVPHFNDQYLLVPIAANPNLFYAPSFYYQYPLATFPLYFVSGFNSYSTIGQMLPQFPLTVCGRCGKVIPALPRFPVPNVQPRFEIVTLQHIPSSGYQTSFQTPVSQNRDDVFMPGPPAGYYGRPSDYQGSFESLPIRHDPTVMTTQRGTEPATTSVYNVRSWQQESFPTQPNVTLPGSSFNRPLASNQSNVLRDVLCDQVKSLDTGSSSTSSSSLDTETYSERE